MRSCLVLVNSFGKYSVDLMGPDGDTVHDGTQERADSHFGIFLHIFIKSNMKMCKFCVYFSNHS